jgi:hypothetical protein
MASGAGLVVWGVQLFHSPSSMIELVGFLALFFFLYAVIAFAVMREKVGAIITLFGLEKFLRFLPVPEFLSRVLKLQNSGRREP